MNTDNDSTRDANDPAPGRSFGLDDAEGTEGHAIDPARRIKRGLDDAEGTESHLYVPKDERADSGQAQRKGVRLDDASTDDEDTEGHAKLRF